MLSTLRGLRTLKKYQLLSIETDDVTISIQDNSFKNEVRCGNSISNFHESLQKQHSVRPYLDTYHLNDLNSRNVPEMGCSFIQCNIQGLFPTRSGKKICYKTLYISDLTELQVCNETPTKPNGQLKIDHRVFLRKNMWKPF